MCVDGPSGPSGPRGARAGPGREDGAGSAAAGPAYDYVLAVGPGRSGSTFLYRLLDAHPAFVAPAIKEGHYYRSPRRFERARRRLRGARAMLLDVANTAWADPRLARVAELGRRGHRVLLIVLLRRHAERAVSVIAFRRSRVVPAVFAGRRGLERAALGESLTPAALGRVLGLGADVLTIAFPALVRRPAEVLEAIAGLCATAGFELPCANPVNETVRARHRLLTGVGKLAAMALRGAGAHRALQALKDRPAVMRVFFVSEARATPAPLGAAAAAALDAHYEGCLATLAARGECLGDGLWFTPGSALESAPESAPGSAPGSALEPALEPALELAPESALESAAESAPESAPESSPAGACGAVAGRAPPGIGVRRAGAVR